MLFIDVKHLKSLKVFGDNKRFAIDRDTSQAVYEVVEAPIKVKFDKDLIVLLTINENGKLSYNPLKSTERKFQSDYVNQVVNDWLEYDSKHDKWLVKPSFNALMKRF
jgi:hypothetical protein